MSPGKPHPSKLSTPRVGPPSETMSPGLLGELPRARQVVDGKYRLMAKVGEGGMGVVFRAEDLRLKREVAIKFLHPRSSGDPERSQMFLREAESMAKLRHPNVVEVYDVGRLRDSPYLVMPFLHGANVEDWAERQGGPPLSPDEVVGIMGQACAGLQAIHQQGLIHGDVKPSNILVSDAFEVMVTDLGLARAVEEDTGELTPPGTPGFLAPELIAREDVPSALVHKADVYALGVTAYWLLTGRMPVGDDEQEAYAMLVKQLEEPVVPPSERHPGLGVVFDEPLLLALDRSPARRPDAVELRDALFAARDRRHVPGAGQRPFVVLVDDDDGVLTALEAVVRATLHEPRIVAVRDPLAALSVIESRPPALIITDLQMPRLSGVEFVAALRESPSTRDVPVVVLTGVGGARDWQQLVRMGVRQFLVKPVTVDI
ncbi:MAG: protein kinase, partial [Myxococcales bacterium]|nr:protein kinase [Myxococcales bacterium]